MRCRAQPDLLARQAAFGTRPAVAQVIIVH